MKVTGSRLSENISHVSSEVHLVNGAQKTYRCLRIQFLWDMTLRHWVIEVDVSRQRRFRIFNSQNVRKNSSGRQWQ